MESGAARSGGRIPYTIVGGFLGAGKTSLISGILRSAADRVAVIVNDLGELGLDAEVLRRATGSPGGSESVELSGGCVCCTVGTSLAATLRDLCLRDSPPDRIVLECSGVADPGRVARYGSRKVMEEPIIVVVVDALDIGRRRLDRNWSGLVEAQLAAADVVVLSKTDLTSGEESRPAGVRQWLTARRPEVPVVVGRPDEIGRVVTPAEWSHLPTVTGSDHGDHGDHGDGGEGGGRGPSYEVRSHRFTSEVDVSEVEDLLGRVDGLVRAKGVVRTPRGPAVVQWSAGRCEFGQWPGSLEAAEGLTMVVARVGTSDRVT